MNLVSDVAKLGLRDQNFVPSSYIVEIYSFVRIRDVRHSKLFSAFRGGGAAQHYLHARDHGGFNVIRLGTLRVVHRNLITSAGYVQSLCVVEKVLESLRIQRGTTLEYNTARNTRDVTDMCGTGAAPVRFYPKTLARSCREWAKTIRQAFVPPVEKKRSFQ